jgi:hypothetical protein
MHALDRRGQAGGAAAIGVNSNSAWRARAARVEASRSR